MGDEEQIVKERSVEHAHPLATQEKRGDSTTQLFLGDIDEEKRLAISGERSDLYFNDEGWMKDWGGKVEPDSIPLLKPVSLARRQVWKIIGHRAFQIFPNEPMKAMRWINSTMKEINNEANKLHYPERADFLEAIYCYFMDKHGLGLKQPYQSEWDDSIANAMESYNERKRKNAIIEIKP